MVHLVEQITLNHWAIGPNHIGETKDKKSLTVIWGVVFSSLTYKQGEERCIISTEYCAARKPSGSLANYSITAFYSFHTQF
jgi:hypothetical protein